MISRPTSVDPVKQTLRTARVLDEAPTDDRPRPGDHLEDALGQPGLQRQLAEAQRRQRGQPRRLQHHRVAGRQRRGEAPAGDRHREVPGHDEPDHPERLLEGDVHAAGDRDLSAQLALRRAGVIVEDVADVARLPARVGDGVPRVRHLERAPAPRGRRRRPGRSGAGVGPGRRGDVAAQRRLGAVPPRRSPRRPRPRSAWGTSAKTAPVAGLTTGALVLTAARSRGTAPSRSPTTRRRPARPSPCWCSGPRPRRRRRIGRPRWPRRARSASASVPGHPRHVGRRVRVADEGRLELQSLARRRAAPPATSAASAR